MTETRKIRITNVQRYSGDPKQDVDLVVTVDWQLLATTIGVKAFFNTGKKSRALSGAIKVTAVAA